MQEEKGEIRSLKENMHRNSEIAKLQKDFALREVRIVSCLKSLPT